MQTNNFEEVFAQNIKQVTMVQKSEQLQVKCEFPSNGAMRVGQTAISERFGSL